MTQQPFMACMVCGKEFEYCDSIEVIQETGGGIIRRHKEAYKCLSEFIKIKATIQLNEQRIKMLEKHNEEQE